MNHGGTDPRGALTTRGILAWISVLAIPINMGIEALTEALKNGNLGAFVPP